jgi:serine protease inhibitor
MKGNAGADDLVELPAGDDESYREYGRQLAMDALLQLALETPAPEAATVEPAARAQSSMHRRWKWLAAIAAVCVIAAVAPYIFHEPVKVDPPKIAHNDPPKIAHNDPPPMMPAQDPTSPPPPKANDDMRLAGWNVEPTGEAVFHVAAKNRINLARGELHIVPMQAAGLDPLVIETSFGTATAHENAEFLIGTYPPPLVKGPEIPMYSPMTRVLVLAGAVTLTSPAGMLTGDSSQLLAAEVEKAPVGLAVEATNGFAFDLYGELSRQNADAGLFFSPYSLSIALAMTAEGARGETAEQMARVLHFSDAARRVGSDAQAIPFNVALIHTGFASLNKRWNRNNQGDREVRKQIESLRKDLTDANNQAAALRKAGKNDESNKFALKSQDLAGKLNALSAKVDQFELNVANALWGEKTYPFRQDYIDTIHRYYSSGGVFPVDFKNQYEAARQQINRWASEQTKQKIPELISRNMLSPEDGKRARLILTNAIYFKGEWSTVFSEGETKDNDFLLADGSKSRVPLMHHGYLGAGYAAFNGDGTSFDTPREVPFDNPPQLYPDDDGFAALELPYKGDELSMVLIAPRSANRLPAVEKLLTAERWPSLVKALVARPVDTFVPRFKMEKSFELSDVMKSLGMGLPFELPGPEGADFSGMCSSDDPEHRLSIGKVVHAAQVEVTEKGTEAAAATAVIMLAPPSARPEMRPFTPQFRADRPFVFLIRDRKSDTILFMGRVTNPKGK